MHMIYIELYEYHLGISKTANDLDSLMYVIEPYFIKNRICTISTS